MIWLTVRNESLKGYLYPDSILTLSCDEITVPTVIGAVGERLSTEYICVIDECLVRTTIWQSALDKGFKVSRMPAPRGDIKSESQHHDQIS